MSRALGVLAIAAFAVMAPETSAQEPDVQVLRGRVETLREAYRDAARRVQQYDELMRPVEDVVEITEGIFALHTRTEFAELTRRAVRAAVDSLTRQVGSAVELIPPLDATVLVSEQRRTVDGEESRFYVVMIMPSSFNEARGNRRWYGTNGGELGRREDIEVEITDRLLGMSYRTLDEMAGRDMMFWVDQRPIRPVPALFDYRPIYRAVVVSPYQVGRACVAGDDAACVRAFGLEEGSTWTDWYQGNDLRALVRSAHADPGRMSPEAAVAYESCLTGVPGDCRTFMETHFEDRRIGEPFGSPVRGSLLQVTFAMGGADVYRRFLESTGTVRERLETTAGSSLHEILDEWRSTLEGTAGKPVTTPLGTALLALTWTVVFAFLGLRSTPWR